MNEFERKGKDAAKKVEFEPVSEPGPNSDAYFKPIQFVPSWVVDQGLSMVHAYLMGYIRSVSRFRTDLTAGEKMIVIDCLLSEYDDICKYLEKKLKERENELYGGNDHGEK